MKGGAKLKLIIDLSIQDLRDIYKNDCVIVKTVNHLEVQIKNRR